MKHPKLHSGVDRLDGISWKRRFFLRWFCCASLRRRYGKHERCTWPKHSTHLIICGVRPLNAILQVTHNIFTIGCRHVLWVKICLLKSNLQRHGVCHSLLSALPWKFFYFWKYFLFGPEHHSNGPENNNTYGPKKKRAGKVWAGKTWAGSSAYRYFSVFHLTGLEVVASSSFHLV